MAKFLTKVTMDEGTQTQFESDNVEDIFLQLRYLNIGCTLRPAQQAKDSADARGALAAQAAAVAAAPPAQTAAQAAGTEIPAWEISRMGLSLAVDEPYEKKGPQPGEAVALKAAKKLRTDQKKGAAPAAAAAGPAVVAAAEEALAHAQGTRDDLKTTVVAVEVPAKTPVKSDTYELLVSSVRNFARGKGIPAATKLVAEFKTAKGDTCARLDQVQAADYAAMLARIEGLSA